MKRALLLNATWEPLNFISDFRAIGLLLKGRAEVVHMDGRDSVWDEAFTYANGKIHVPATLRLVKRINRKRTPMRFKKRILFNRDAWSCQYCGVKLGYETVTIDHVMPSSRGGVTSYRNCVTACKPCNKRKANYTPDEAGMPLRKAPADPSALHFWDVMKSAAWHEHWDMFIPR
jgi:hypothetical protein